MRILVVVGFAASVSLVSAITPVEMRARAIARYPGFIFTSVERAVATGALASSATTKYGDPATQKRGTTLSGATTISTTWPEAGVFRKIDGEFLGIRHRVENSRMASTTQREFLYFDGEKRYIHSLGGGRDHIHVNRKQDRMNDGMVVDVWDSWVSEEAHPKSRIDPVLGKILTYEEHGVVSDVAVERDWMVVKRTGSNADMEVTKLAKVEGCWLPVQIKASRFGLDIYCEATFKLAKTLKPADFTPKTSSKTLWIEDNVFYDVVAGKLVRSKMQPDRTSEYLSWAGMGAVALLILGALGSQAHKLFGKSNGSIFTSKQGTGGPGKDV